jgi:hypothetical protein
MDSTWAYEFAEELLKKGLSYDLKTNFPRFYFDGTTSV